MRNLPYDPVAAFTHVSLVAVMPMLIVANPQVPARNVGELVALLNDEISLLVDSIAA